MARLESIRLERTGLCWVRLDWGPLGLARLGWNDLDGFGWARRPVLGYVWLGPAGFGCAQLCCAGLGLGWLGSESLAALGWVRLSLGWGQLGSTWIVLAGLGMHITYKALDYLHMRIPNPSKFIQNKIFFSPKRSFMQRK